MMLTEKLIFMGNSLFWVEHEKLVTWISPQVLHGKADASFYLETRHLQTVGPK